MGVDRLNSANLHLALFFGLLLLPFSPFYSYIILFFAFLLGSKYISKTKRIFFSLALIWNIAALYASKIYFHVALDFDDDFSRYYQNYLDIYDGLSGSLNVWNSANEIGLGVFYKILSLLLPRLLPSQLLFITALCIASLFYIWLEMYILGNIPKAQRACLVAFAMFVDVFVESIGLTRQAFACVFLLFVFNSKNLSIKILFLIVATMFHTSSILVFALFLVVRRYPRICLCILLLLFFVFVDYASFINTHIRDFALILKDYLPSKLYTYFISYIDTNGFNLYYYRYLPIIKVIFMIGAIFGFFALNPRDKLAIEYKYIASISFIIFILQFIPTRIVFLWSHILFYFLCFVAFRRVFYLVFPAFFFYFLYRFYKLFIHQDSPLFFSYEESSFIPFYYLF